MSPPDSEDGVMSPSGVPGLFALFLCALQQVQPAQGPCCASPDYQPQVLMPDFPPLQPTYVGQTDRNWKQKLMKGQRLGDRREDRLTGLPETLQEVFMVTGPEQEAWVE